MFRKNAASAENSFPILSALSGALEVENLRNITSSLHNAIDPADIAVLVFFGYCTVPITRFVRSLIANKSEIDFDQTYTYLFSFLFSQLVRVALIVLAADCLDVIMESVGIEIAERVDFGYVVARVAYTVWAAFQFAAFKRYLIAKAVESKQPDKLGRAFLLDRLVNFAIAMVTGLFIVDLLDVEIGAGFASVFALGGVGTIIVSLASKDLAEQLLSGMFLHVSDKFYEGDLCRFGDGTSGTVFKIGWMHTIIRLADDTRMRIPNSQLANKTVTNLSRCTQCQVKTVLYFAFSDMEKLPALVKDIKEAVKVACAPDLIIDGSRPLRVHWTDFTTDRLEVVCDFHFNLKPYGDVYLDNRQRCLEAIGSALMKNNLECAVPTHCKKQI